MGIKVVAFIAHERVGERGAGRGRSMSREYLWTLRDGRGRVGKSFTVSD